MPHRRAAPAAASGMHPRAPFAWVQVNPSDPMYRCCTPSPSEDSVTMLTKPPFDKPLSFTRLFDKKMQMEIMAAINKVKDNAVVIAA